MKRSHALALGIGLALLASSSIGSCIGPGLEPPTAPSTIGRNNGAAGTKGVLDMGTNPGAAGTGAAAQPPTTGVPTTPAAAGGGGTSAAQGDAGRNSPDEADAGPEDAGL